MPASQHSTVSARSGNAVVADAAISPPPRGIHCNSSGTATVRFAGNQADVTLTFTAGSYYPYEIVVFRSAGLTGTYVYIS